MSETSYKNKIKDVEKRVLDVYKKEIPSVYKIEESEDTFKKIIDYGDRLFTHSLKILPAVFKNAKLLEFGTGSGERSMNYLRWGAKCTFVELNDLAIKRAKYLFQKYYPDAEYKIQNQSLFDYQTDDVFDITISNAVLHHTADKEKGFSKLVSNLRPGGINIIGIGNTASCLERNLQRYIVYTFAGNDEKKIENVAYDLFKEHVDRSMKYGGRTKRAIIYDSYVNPKLDFISVKELLDWYRKYGLKHYSSWPPIIPAILADDLAGNIDWRNYPELLSQPEWIWATQINNDEEIIEELNEQFKPHTSAFRNLASSLNDIEPGNLDCRDVRDHISEVQSAYFSHKQPKLEKLRSMNEWLNEIDHIMMALDKRDYDLVSKIAKTSSHLFRGKGGIGLNYFAAIKE